MPISRARKSRQVSIPPPIGGWNTRDDPAQMGPSDATHLVNFWPEQNQVSLRKGFSEHSTGVGSGNVDTVVEYFSGTTRHLLAASPTNIYNATSPGAATSLHAGFANGRWQSAMMNGILGLVNGADTPQIYNGSTIEDMTAITGTTGTELIGIHVFKSRSYFWKAASPSFWYSATNALGGAVTEFALGQVARLGGSLVRMHSWTVDGGDGVDDYSVFLMSSGEVLVYQGSDPGSSSAWALVGSYRIPAPLGIRCAEKVGGKLGVLTDRDIVFLPDAFNQPSPPASKLKGALEVSGPVYRSNYGWQALYYARRDMLILNVPVSATQFEQYVVNMGIGSPARFTNQNARAWGVFDNELYFGTSDGRVMQADSVAKDENAAIQADARQAWSDLGSPSNKKVEAFRPVFSGTSLFRVGAEIAYDFRNATVTREVTSGVSGTAWGSPWGSPWSTPLEIRDEWTLANGMGQVVSPQVSIGVDGETPAWYRTDLLVSAAPNI